VDVSRTHHAHEGDGHLDGIPDAGGHDGDGVGADV